MKESGDNGLEIPKGEKRQRERDMDRRIERETEMVHRIWKLVMVKGCRVRRGVKSMSGN